jgi:GAF domain-containing protein
MFFLNAAAYAALRGAMNAHFHALLDFLVGTGARYGEAAGLWVQHLHLDAERPYVDIRAALKWRGKKRTRGRPKTRSSIRRILLPPRLVEALVAELAKQTIPGAAEVSVTLMADGDVQSAAFTGALAAQLDERQYQAGFGPCMDAAISGGIIPIDDTAHSAAYPDFARTARRHGITHTLSTGLPVRRQIIGGLNIYGTDGGAFDEHTRELASTFASYAAVAVANAGLYASTAQLATHLQRALESRAVIDQAKGILMSQHAISADAAFDLLAKQSQLTNRKLRDIAADLVDEVQRGRD